MFGMLGMMGSVSDAGGPAPVTQGKTIFGSYAANSQTVQVGGRYGTIGLTTWQNGSTVATWTLSPGVPGIVTDFQVPVVVTNTTTATSTLGVVNATAATALYATIPAGSTAPAYNLLDLTIGASDYLATYWVRGAGGTLTIYSSQATFEHTGSGHVQLIGGGATSWNSASNTQYSPLAGPTTPAGQATRAPIEIRASTDMRLERFSVKFQNNPRSTSSTLFLMVNGVSIASATIAAGSTAEIVLLPAYDVVAGDLIVWGITLGSGTGILSPAGTLLTMRHLTEAKSDVWVTVENTAYSLATPYYFPIYGRSSTSSPSTTTRSYNSFQVLYDAGFAVPQCYVQTNTSTVPCTIRLLINGVASGVSITIPVGSGAGWITGTGTAIVASGDEVVWEALGPVASGGSGSLVVPMVGVQMQYLSG